MPMNPRFSSKAQDFWAIASQVKKKFSLGDRRYFGGIGSRDHRDI
jgi:hypothetical protein